MGPDRTRVSDSACLFLGSALDSRLELCLGLGGLRIIGRVPSCAVVRAVAVAPEDELMSAAVRRADQGRVALVDVRGPSARANEEAVVALVVDTDVRALGSERHRDR